MIECPALHVRHHDKGYPFGERVPAKIRMTRTVVSDFLFLGKDHAKTAVNSAVYDAWTNSYGAVAAVMENGNLGVKPGEFEVVEWFDPPSETPPSRNMPLLLALQTLTAPLDLSTPNGNTQRK